MVAVQHSHVFHHLQGHRAPPSWFRNAYEGALFQEVSPFPILCAENHASIDKIAGPVRSADASTNEEVSGYLCGIPQDNYKGKDLQNVLQDRDIVIDLPPPLQPITDTTRYASHGVIKINNIPFTVSAQEIIQFVNRFSPVPMLKKSPEGYPIHIIMEKPTGKTMDCFIEFPTHAAARECVRRFDDTSHPGKGARLGTRNVNFELSDQAELMHALFPRARLVEFDSLNGAPKILSRCHDPSWSAGFRGYFTLEEVYGVVRFAECPSRSPFVLKCHQRPYECMISTLYKFPWAATETYTVAARNALFESAWRQLTVLSKKVGCPTGPAAETSMVLHNYNGKNYFTNKNPLTCDPAEVHLENREVGLSQSLLFDLLFAAVNVPAFNLLQKLALCQAAGSYGRAISLHPFSHTWPFQTLEPVNGTSDHVIKFWLELFDTGFDIMESENSRTPFEHYLVFTRNKIGFPIAEWTNAGIELPFDDAICVETAAMMCYVSRGRDAWAAGQQIDAQSWQPESLVDLMEAATLEKYSNKSCEQENLSRGARPETPSPRTSTNGGPSHNEFHLPKWPSNLGITEKHRLKDERLSRGRQCNVVTGKDPVPGSVNAIETNSGTSSSGGAAIVDRLARPFTNCIDLGQSPAAVKTLPGPQALKPETDVVNLPVTFNDPFAAQVDSSVLLGRQTSSDASVSPFQSTIPQQLSDTANSLFSQLAAVATSSGNGRPISPLAVQPHDIVLTDVARQNHLRTPSHTQPRQINSDDVAQRLGSSLIQDDNAFSSDLLIQGSSSVVHDNDPFISAKISLRPVQTYPTMHNAAVGNFGPIGSGVRASSIQLPSSTYAGDAECSHVYSERPHAQSIQVPVTNTPKTESLNCVRRPRISATDLWDNINVSRRR